jgi:hypothetical protein
LCPRVCGHNKNSEKNSRKDVSNFRIHVNGLK